MNDYNELIERFEDDDPCNIDWGDCKPGPDDCRDGRREKFGNNRKKIKKSVKRKLAAIAKKSRRRNRR